MAGAALEISPGEMAGLLGRKVEDLARADFTPAWQRVKVLLVSEARRCFASSMDPNGKAWLPLKNPSKKRGGPSSKPLRDKGLLMGSLTAGGQGHQEELTPQGLVWGTRLPYASVHQHGHTFHRPERTRDRPWVFLIGGKQVFTRRIRAHTIIVPARAFLGLGERTMSRVLLILSERAEQVFGK